MITGTALRLNGENSVILFCICEICFEFTDEDIQLSLSVFNTCLWCRLVQHQSQNRTGKGLITNRPVCCKGYLNCITHKFGSLLALKLNEMQLGDLMLQTLVVCVHCKQHAVH